MNSKISWLAAVCGLGMILSLAMAQKPDTSAAVAEQKRWEHLAMSVSADEVIGNADTSGKIVQLGNDGWELVTVESVARQGASTRMLFFFKRPK